MSRYFKEPPTTIVLTQNQADGIDPLLPRDKARESVTFIAAADFKISIKKQDTVGLPILATLGHPLSGDICPKNAMYLVAGSGLVVGNSLTVWSA